MSNPQETKKLVNQQLPAPDPTTQTPPSYHQLIRIGHRDLKGLTLLTTAAVINNMTDQDVVREILRRWQAHWFITVVAWLFLFKRQTLVLAVVGLTASIDLEAQLGTVPVNVSRVIHDCLLQLASARPEILLERRILVRSDQILTSGRAFSADPDPLAIILVWERTKKPALLLSGLLALASILVGVGIGVSSKSVETGFTFAASVAAVLTLVESLLVFVFGQV